MTSPTKLSVLIPNTNHQKSPDQRIQTVLHQTFQYFEVISCTMHLKLKG
jgi:hypothetical protein